MGQFYRGASSSVLRADRTSFSLTRTGTSTDREIESPSPAPPQGPIYFKPRVSDQRKASTPYRKPIPIRRRPWASVPHNLSIAPEKSCLELRQGAWIGSGIGIIRCGYLDKQMREAKGRGSSNVAFIDLTLPASIDAGSVSDQASAPP